MSSASEHEELARDWLVGTVIASFRHDAGFVLRFERDVTSSTKPNAVGLQLMSDASVVGPDWQQFISNLPISARRTEAYVPALAYRLALLLGSEVTDVSISAHGALLVATSDEEILIAEGTDAVWEQSWVLFDALSSRDEQGRVLTCSAEGEVFTSVG